MHNVEIVATQLQTRACDLEANLEEIRYMVKSILKSYPGTALIVFPELALSGYESFDKIEEIAEIPGKGSGTLAMCDLAKEYKVDIIVGYAEQDSEAQDKFYNSIIYINQNGEILANYRKINLVNKEKDVFEAGSEFVLCNTSYGKLGLCICWDGAFPEIGRIYCENGADFLIVSAAWEKPYMSQWEVMLRANAVNNGVYVVASNQVGKGKELAFFGDSMIIDGMGEIMESCQDIENSYVHCTCDIDELKVIREAFATQLKDINSNIYQKENLKNSICK